MSIPFRTTLMVVGTAGIMTTAIVNYFSSNTQNNSTVYLSGDESSLNRLLSHEQNVRIVGDITPIKSKNGKNDGHNIY